MTRRRAKPRRYTIGRSSVITGADAPRWGLRAGGTNRGVLGVRQRRAAASSTLAAGGATSATSRLTATEPQLANTTGRYGLSRNRRNILSNRARFDSRHAMLHARRGSPALVSPFVVHYARRRGNSAQSQASANQRYLQRERAVSHIWRNRRNPRRAALPAKTRVLVLARCPAETSCTV